MGNLWLGIVIPSVVKSNEMMPSTSNTTGFFKSAPNFQSERSLSGFGILNLSKSPCGFSSHRNCVEFAGLWMYQPVHQTDDQLLRYTTWDWWNVATANALVHCLKKKAHPDRKIFASWKTIDSKISGALAILCPFSETPSQFFINIQSSSV